jgi:competence protein ComEC
LNTAIIRLSILLLLGICSGFFLELPLKMAFLALLPGIVLFLLAYFRARKLLFPDLFFGSSTTLLFFLFGIFSASLHLPQNQPKHYIHKISSEKAHFLKLSIFETLKPDAYSDKYIAEVNAVNGKSAHGKLLVLLPKDSLKKPFLEGEQLLISADLTPVPPPLNLHQFNYADFMNRKGVWRQANLRQGTFKKLQKKESGLKTSAANWRRKISAALKKHHFEQDELSLVQALLLGQKQDISAQTYNNFAAAGAIHILAVSGLHVGIIMLMLHWLFKPLTGLKNGKFLKTFLVILFLWGFAVLAGLSPSVVRAVTMFSFLAVSLEIKRRTGTLNSIFLSLLLLLLVKPGWIFEVGFQLSYLAVLSIVLFQPLLNKLYTPANRILKYFWDLLSVTLAAQLGVLPLSLYYFHQFPGLFFLTNLLILPFLGVILIMGVLVIILAVVDILSSFIAETYGIIIKILIKTVDWIAGHEQFLFKDIGFSLAEVLSWYLFLFTAFLLWKSFGYKRLLAVLISVIILQSVYISSEVRQENRLIVFHKSRSSLVATQHNDQLMLYHNLKSPAKDLKLLQNFMVGEDLQQIREAPLKNIYLQKGHFLMLIDSSGFLPKQTPLNTHLLLTGAPGINLERLLMNLKPAAIIADGSNYPSVIKKWKKTAKAKHIPFFYTGEDGAYILE